LRSSLQTSGAIVSLKVDEDDSLQSQYDDIDLHEP
jgi:hypothetical protein